MGGWSDYNSLQISFKKRMSHGLCCKQAIPMPMRSTPTPRTGGMVLSRTFRSPKIRDSVTGTPGWTWRHTFSGSFIYDCPFFGAEGLLNKGPVLNGFVGGWQLSNTWQAQTGIPFSPTWGGGGSNFSGSGTWYPNRICNGAISNPSIEEWFNPACFPSAAQGTYGNSGRNILFKPGFFNMNTSHRQRASRLRWLGEAGLLQVRVRRVRCAQPPQLQPTQRVNCPRPGSGITSTAKSITSACTPITWSAYRVLAVLPPFVSIVARGIAMPVPERLFESDSAAGITSRGQCGHIAVAVYGHLCSQESPGPDRLRQA